MDTPASGDTVDFYILYTTGDPDGAATDEYDTVAHAMHVTTLDTNSEDPARKTVEIPVVTEKVNTVTQTKEVPVKDI